MTSLKSSLLAIVASASLAVATPVPNEPALPNNATDTVITFSGPNFYSGPWYNFPGMETWLSYDELVRTYVSTSLTYHQILETKHKKI